MAFESNTSIPVASQKMNEAVSYIRAYLRDFPELNRLVKGEETSDRMIAWAIIDVLDDFNSTPPFIGSFSLQNFPSASLLRMGVAALILESVSILQTRNQLNYSDGGIQVNVSDKGPALIQFASMLNQRYITQKNRIKGSLNVELCFEGAGVFSEYFVINGLYFSNF